MELTRTILPSERLPVIKKKKRSSNFQLFMKIWKLTLRFHFGYLRRHFQIIIAISIRSATIPSIFNTLNWLTFNNYYNINQFSRREGRKYENDITESIKLNHYQRSRNSTKNERKNCKNNRKSKSKVLQGWKTFGCFVQRCLNGRFLSVISASATTSDI